MNPRLLLPTTALLAGALACALPNPLTQQRTPTAAPVSAPVTTTTDTTTAPATNVTTNILTSSEEQALISLYDQVNPAVVSIQVSYGLEGSQGSGFLYDTEGHIVTNQHVVEGAQFIEVDFPSGLKTEGKVVGVDTDADLAVIKVEQVPEGITPLPLADSDAVQVGQRAIAIGNPFGESGSMTLGIVSGKGRSLSDNRTGQTASRFTSPDIIQTDAPINPGNSGGPLLNMSGEVIGINRAIATETGAGSGVGYAIPSNTVRQIVPYLITEGRFTYPYFGMSSGPEISLQAAEELGLSQASGVYVVGVVPGGPAEQGGLRGDSATDRDTSYQGDGDLIVAIDGQPVNIFEDLISYINYNKRPGDTVVLTVLRRTERVDLTITLGERPLN
ncbi:MAG: trypsin-like peptidase domain-containing protein [Anaerolineales bacterium]|nr:trypsin-like peptidase domain-containing protein [Anaerolineales bacterium]